MEVAGEQIERHEVCHRFSEFSTLDAAIRKALPATAVAHLPVLPSHFSLNKFSESVVAHRQVILDKYVRALLTEEEVRVGALSEVVKFFSPQKF